MPLQDIQKQFLKRCAESPAFFISQLAYIQHPTFGKMRFNLFDYQINAIRDFLKYRFNIFHKVRQCFVAGTPVWTPKGPIPIESLKPGDIVYTYDLNSKQIMQQPIIRVIDNGISNDIVEVRSKTGHRVNCTSDHRYLVDGNWVEANKITKDDVLTEVYDAPRYGKPLHPSDPILLGYLLTDGCCRESGFYFSNTRFKYLLDYQKHLTRRVGRQAKIKKQHSKGNRHKLDAYRIYGYGNDRKLLEDYDLCGKIRDQKLIPQAVFEWGNQHIAQLLSRMFAGDGWYSGRDDEESKRGCGNEIGICSESLLVLQQIRLLLSRFHISASIYPCSGKKGSIHKLRILDATNINRFVEQIGIFGKNLRKAQTRGFHFNRKVGAVRSVIPVQGEARIYDLEVPPHHNFIVDGAVVHNSGVSTLCGAFALWRGMFFKNKTILVVSKTDETAMEFLRRNVKYVYENLPPWMKDLWPIEQNEHRVVFHNGSRITSLTSAPNTLRSNSSTLNIIDEAAFMPKMEEMWAGGWPCARGDTLIQTTDGLIAIQNLAAGGNPWRDLDINVATDDGIKHSNKAYVSGRHPTKKIITKLGYEFEGTLHHRLRVIDESGEYIWRKLEDLNVGDIIVSIPGKFTGKRRHLKDGTELGVELAEILGLYVGDGSLSVERPKRFKIVFDPQDVKTRNKIVEQFNSLNLKIDTEAYCETEYDTENFRLNSAEFIEIMQENGLNSKTQPQDAVIPELILMSDEKVLCAFLRGLFDADGWCYQSSTCLKLGLSTTSEKLAEQVQTALHSLGIIARRYQVDPAMVPDRNDMRYSDKPYWRVDIWDAASKKKYRDLIGFITERKQKALDSFDQSDEHATIIHPVLVKEFANAALHKILAGSSFKKCTDSRKWNLLRITRTGRARISLVKEMGLDDRLSKLVAKGFFFDTVTAVFNGECETFDISVPDNNTYLANGIISHNTLQTGGNVIVISTPNGIGNWYWRNVKDAIEGNNDFHLIKINWWDMTYRLEGFDPAMKRKVIIDPTAGLTDCATKEEKARFGLKKSPWLEEQYRGMASRGEDRLFRQEYLCEFLGTGNTVLSREQLEQIELTVSEDFKTVGTENYVNPSTQERARLEFDDKLWIWEKPVKGHIYVAGVDTSSGEAHDYSGVVVWDITTKTQVAELRIRTRPKNLALMVDYIGRVYNNAMVVVERNSIGITVVQALWQDLSYPSLFREVKQNKKLRRSMGLLGFTTGVKSKGELNAALQNNIGDGGYEIRSRRLKNEADIYVYHTRNQTGAEDGPGNTDDLIIAAALGLIGRDQATRLSGFLPPPVHDMVAPNLRDKKKNWDETHKDIVDKYATKGTKIAVPLVINSESISGRQNSFGELGVFMAQMQAKKPDNNNTIPIVVDKSNNLKKPK